MKRTQLYELAVTTGKGLITENSTANIDIAIGNAAKENAVSELDFAEFKNYVLETRSFQTRLGQRPLPSELAALKAASQPGVVPSPKAVPANSPEAHGAATIESAKAGNLPAGS
jgi:hypothetical protein